MKACLALLLSLLCLGAMGCGSGRDRVHHLGFVQIAEEPFLNEARQGVLDGLKERGYENGKNLTIDFRSAAGSLDAIPAILRDFKTDNTDLIITNSTPCMLEAAKIIRSIPVVSAVCFSPDQMGIRPPSNLTGVYDPFDMAAFVALIREALPGLTRLGLPYHDHEPNAIYALNRLREAARAAGIEVDARPIGPDNDVAEAARLLADRKVQAFAACADNALYLALPALIQVANERKLPVFTTEPSLVDRGVAIGYGVDYYLWGKTAGRMAAGILNGAPIEPMQSLSQLRLAVNEKACERQGLVVPETIRKRVKGKE